MEPPHNTPELPDPSPELILLLALVQAHCRSLSRKERNRFLLDVSESLGLQEASYNVLKFRTRSEDRAVLMAMRQAGAWWKQGLAVLWRLEV